MDFFVMNLLASAADTNNGAGGAGGATDPSMYIMLGVFAVAVVVMLIFSNRSNKKRQQEEEERIATINAVRPGNKVKTIGLICGIVVEVDDEENTFVLETGNELNGKSYMKFDKQAIYQTDAKPKTKDKDAKEKDGKEEVAEEKTSEKEKKEEK